MAKKQAANKDEQIGFHKGALSTLAKEREEMLKILNVVEQLMKLHVNSLKDLGVDLEAATQDSPAASKGAKKKKKAKPIEDLLR